MNLVQRAIKRPVGIAMIFAALLLLGGISLAFLPLDLLPDVSYPVLSITTELGGYSPVEIAQTITKPMEASLASMNNLVRLKSVSKEGKSELSLEFRLGTEMDFILQEVRERIHQLLPEFPTDTRTPRLAKYDPNASPIMVVSLFGDLDSTALRTVGEDILQKNLARVQGVAHVEVVGGKKREIIIEPDLEKLRAMGLSILELNEILKNNNMGLALGSLSQGAARIPLRSTGEFRDLNDIRNIGITRTPAGSLVYLSQIAKVEYGSPSEETISRYKGEPRVMVLIYREYGAHIVEVSQELRRTLERMQTLLPAGLKTETIYDQGEFILNSLRRLRDAGLVGAFFAIIVVWIFLRHWPSTLIIVLAIPVSVLATFGVMYLSGITLNIISLAGLTLGIGMLVDNAIVVVENIYRYQKDGYAPAAAAATGTIEVIQAISAATLIHLAVFFPIFFMQKKVRLFYQDLCYTVSIALLISLAVAVVLVPVIVARCPAPRQTPQWLPRLARRHRRLLIKVLRRPLLWVACSSVLLGVSLLGIPHLGFESSTRVDRGEFTLIMQTQTGTIQQVIDELARQAEQYIQQQPEVKDVSTRIHDNSASLQIKLVPSKDRSLTTRELVEKIRPAIKALPLALASFQLEQRSGSDNAVTLEVTGPEQDKLIKLALALRSRLSQLPQLKDIVIHLSNPVPEMEVRIDQVRAAYLGLNVAEIAHTIRASLTGPLANRFREQDKEIDIRTRLQSQDKESLQLLQELRIPKLAAWGQKVIQVPLWPALVPRFTMGITALHRINQQLGIELSADISNIDLTRAAALLQPVIDRIYRPPGYEIRLGQSFAELAESRKEVFFALLLAIVLIYMIMAGLFETFRTPLIIICSVPMAAVGVVAALYITGNPISISVYIGMLALAGIVVNNAIILVDHINRLRSRGLTYYRAIVKGAQDRLRPILITSATAILGLAPMGLEGGEGAQLWSPLAWTIIGGLISSTLLTLFIIPVVYSIVMSRSANQPSN